MRRRRTAAPTRAAAGGVLLDARRLRVRRGGATLLDDVDLCVRAGEVVALVGPNGAGKSTLLRAVCGDVAAAGEVHLGGRPLAAWTAAEVAVRRAVLPQEVAIAFPFTVADVVRMGRAPWTTVSPTDDDAIVAAALEDCDAAHLASRPFPTLSGGEQARVSLARVLAQRAQLLLLDEPTAALDLRHQEQVLSVIRRRAVAGDGVVVVIHDLTAAAACADRLVLLDRGAVVADGPPARVLDTAVLEAVYRQPVEVFPSPLGGALTVVPRRSPVRPLADAAARTGAP